MTAGVSFGDFLDAPRRQASGLSAASLARLEALFASGAGLAAALANRADLGDPPPAALQALAGSYREYRRWRAAATRAAGVPTALLARTRHPSQIAVLQRGALRLGAEGPLAELLDLWNAALGLALKEGEVRAEPPVPIAGQPLPAAVAVWADQAGGAPPEELSDHRWLAWRRGEREEGLRLRVVLPEPAIREQLALRPTLATACDAASCTLEELVLASLPAAVRQHLDERAAEAAGVAAAAVYQGLLGAPGVRAARLTACFVGAPRQALGVVLVDGTGRRQDSLRVAQHPAWEPELRSWLTSHPAELLVLPTGAPDDRRLGRVRIIAESLGLSVSLVRPAGLAEARAALLAAEGGLPAEVASALLLARHSLDPWKALSELDPVALGLAEYQQDLDAAVLRARLDDVRTLVRWQRGEPVPHAAEPGAAAAPEGGPATRTGASARPVAPTRLNPLVKSLADLRPGMQVSAVITNLTPFGAFATIGLPQEALIHVSELSDEFVQNPAEVVQIGQPVRARVLEVDRERGRIGLTLKSGGGSDDDARLLLRRSGSGGKGKALAELEKLFRK